MIFIQKLALVERIGPQKVETLSQRNRALYHDQGIDTPPFSPFYEAVKSLDLRKSLGTIFEGEDMLLVEDLSNRISQDLLMFKNVA